MKYVQAVISLGLFGWLSFAVFTGEIASWSSGSGKSRAISGLISTLTERFGTTQTAIGLLGIGLLLAAFFLMRRQEYYEE